MISSVLIHIFRNVYSQIPIRVNRYAARIRPLAINFYTNFSHVPRNKSEDA